LVAIRSMKALYKCSPFAMNYLTQCTYCFVCIILYMFVGLLIFLKKIYM